ncbi:MAG: tandem-95 repeat protein [Alphaproteobacteria bacterium]|nr:tandem-95 repeat protein [Alphaproteobacteria bacterium]
MVFLSRVVYSVYAGDGDDDVTLDGNWDRYDSIYLESGDDRIDISNWEGNKDRVHYVYGGSGDDEYIGRDVDKTNNSYDVFYGDDGQDRIIGGDADEYFDGGNDEDTIDGGYGDDILSGGNDSDVITGGDGADTITGGEDADTLTGGSGQDIFVYTSRNDEGDIITDFVAGAGGDLLDLRPLFQNLGYTGADPFGEGWLELQQVGSDLKVNLDRNGGGDNYSDTLVTLQNVNIADFITQNALPAGPLTPYPQPEPGNTPPIVASSVEIVLDEDTSRSGSVGAVDADGDTLSYSVTTAPSMGTASITDDGSFTYTPNANAHGTDSFTITVSDGVASVTQDVSVTVNAVNDAPVLSAGTLSLSLNEDTFTSGVVTAVDVDGDVLVYSFSEPTKGSITHNNDGTYTYTPNADVNGSDVFSVTVSDGVASVTQDVSVTVNAVNDAPVGTNVELEVQENASRNAFIGTVASSFSDIDENDTLIYSINGGNTGSVFSIDQNTGVISLAGVLDYEVTSEYTLEVMATDSGGAFATIDVMIDISDVNEGPIEDQLGSVFVDFTEREDGLLELDFYVDARSSINALDFRFGWDESEVDYVGSNFISGWTFLDNSNAPGTRDFSGYSLSGLTGSSSEYVGNIILDPIVGLDETQVSIRDILINDETGIDTIETLTLATGHDVSGSVEHWNGGSPLDGLLTVAGVRGDTSDDVIQFRDFEVYADGSMSVSLWSDVETESSGSVDFVLSYSPLSLTLTDYTLGSLFAGWEVLETDDPSSGELSVSALSTDLSGGNYINGETLLGTFRFDVEDEGVAYQIGQSSGAVGEIAAEASELYVRTVEVVDGSYSIRDIPQGSYQMDMSRSADDVPRSAIKASDALAALKIGVGVTQDATSHQLIAADVNQNGKVNAQDALEILKIAVNHEDALDKRFVFVDADQDLSGMTARKAQYQTGMRMDDLNADLSDQDFIGILLGDVNGNYVDVI